MGRSAKISSIKRNYSGSQLQTMQSELAKHGMTRVPGTSATKFPYKELTGKYRTGLDPQASYIGRIQDKVAKDVEIERVSKLRKKLEEELGVDLGPKSSFWDHSKSLSAEDQSHVQPVKLVDGDNYFDLGIPYQELAFAWLRVHPTIASSFQAWERGEYAADTQWYVVDDEIENTIAYNKKKAVNKAIITLDKMSPETKRKVARQLGLPVTEDTKEEIVYNLIDDVFKKSEFKSGSFQGLNPIEVFTRFADMKEDILHAKDLVKQAITHSIYRMKPNGKIYEGEAEIAKDEDDLVKFLLNEDHQEDLIMLQQKLQSKKLMSV
jgi:hypothetical protein